MSNKRICIIGAGPSGMSALYQFAKNDTMPDMVCYEKQKTWGGQWNLTWRTGTDEYGEHCHSSMYNDMWTNAPKEVNNEYPDYTFEQHFGQNLPSFIPIEVVKDYLEGRWTRGTTKNLRKFIRFSTAVKYVRYQDDTDDFLVTIEDLEKHETTDEIFSHVLVCAGIYSYPNVPDISGANKFRGRIIHSHNFRKAREFKGQRVLMIGSAFSGTDIAIQCLKFGAKHVVISYKSEPTGLPWPKEIEERPMVEKLDEGKVFFIDGSSSEIDSVIICTGYRNHFPFLEGRLRIEEETSLYPKDLYKATVFIGGGNNKLFYIGALKQIYTMTFFDAVALLITKFILGQLPGEPVSRAEMEAYSKTWVQRMSKLKTLEDFCQYQTDLLGDIISCTDYSKDVLTIMASFKEFLEYRSEGLECFRNHRFRSIFTGTLAPSQTPFMESMDDSKEALLKEAEPLK